MTWWMILLLVLAAAALLGSIRVGVDAVYAPDGSAVSARLGPLRIQLLPQRPKKRRIGKKPRKPAAAPENAAQSATRQQESAQKPAKTAKKPLSLPGSPEGILSMARLAADVLGELRRRLRVEELTVHVTLGGDPADAALAYGRAWALIGALTPLLERIFVIKKRDIRPVLDYNEDKMSVYAHLTLTITIGRALALALRAGFRLLRLLNESKKGGAAV